MATEMQTQAKPGSTERSLPSWLVPVVGLAVVGALAIAYFAGWIGDQPVAMLLAVVYAAIIGGIALKATLEHTHGGLRAAGFVFIALMLFATIYPARELLMPGAPLAEGHISSQNPDFSLPGPGSYHVLVSSRLGEGGETSVGYTITVGDQTLRGTLERVQATRRVGRRGTMQVTEDHDMVAHDVRVGSGAPVIHLQNLEGRSTADLRIRVYSALPPWLMWAAIVLLLVGATALEVKMAARGAMAMTGTAAVCFGLLLASANPGASLGPVFGSALLGAGGGALGGSLLGALGRKLFAKPAPEKASPGKREPGQRGSATK